MTNYQRGYRFERRVRKFLEGLGFQVMRSAGSKGPADLAAFGKGETWLVACKTDRDGFTESVTRPLFEMAEAGGARAMLAWNEGGNPFLVPLRRPCIVFWRPDEEPLPPWYKGEEGDG